MSLLDEIHGALRPKTEPITSTLSELGATSEGFTSVSSVCPVTILYQATEDFKGYPVFDVKLGDTWYPYYPDDPNLVMVPEGCQIRARLDSYVAGSITVKIFQGRTS
jgi:hypothetical protein